ncbi:MAG: hypothetical protein JO051_15475 [Acidobacteriaceae bacterium]|nr:hypothetical protein [Acidobacteriaceae bacterium]
MKTEKGRAELMLTPGVFLRLDENSSVKMVSSALTSTTIEFEGGSAILDALGAQGEIPVTLQFKEAAITFPKAGLYRIDSDTAVLQAYDGEALVKQRDRQTRVDTTRLYFFELGTDTKKFSEGTEDEFLDWTRNRNEVITAQNQIAQQDAEDEADADLGSLGGLPGLNLNPPYGGLGGTPAVPGLGGTTPYGLGYGPYGYGYGYGSFYYNNYPPSMIFGLPPLPVPVLVIRRPWAYRGVSPTWPRSGTWTSRHTTTPTTSTWLASHPITSVYPRTTYVRPYSTISHPAISRPMAVPHVTAAPVHAGARR